jgi:hypothetical protein
MQLRQQILLRTFIYFILFSFLFQSLAPVSLATGWWGSGSKSKDYLEKIGEEGFKTSGPPEEGTLQKTIFKIINYVLGFLGIVFIALIIYGGLVWMTSMGNEQKIEQARKILINAAIGLAIVLAAYALSVFIFQVLLKSTGGG